MPSACDHYIEENVTDPRSSLEKEDYNVTPSNTKETIGSQTHYGNFLGNVSTRYTLAGITLNPSTYNKKQFFKKELKELVELSLKNILEPDILEESWDDSFELSQFMTSSYFKHTVSDKHTSPHLTNYAANYFLKNNYQASKEITKEIRLDEKNDSINIETNFESTDYSEYAPEGEDVAAIEHINESQDDKSYE